MSLFAIQPPDLPATRVAEDEPPPFLGSWGKVYGAVLCYWAVLILILYGFTKVFGRA